MQGRRRQTTVVRRQGSALGPVVAVLIVLALAAGAYLTIKRWGGDSLETLVTRVAPAPAPVAQPAPVAAPAPPSMVEPAPSQPSATTPAVTAPPVVEPTPQPVAEPAQSPPPVVAATPPPVVEPTPQPVVEPAQSLPPAETAAAPPAAEQTPQPVAPPPAAEAAQNPPSVEAAAPPPESRRAAEAKRALAVGDRKAAFGLLTALAEQGDPWGQFELARAYRDGLGTEADPVRALAWLMQAAARGHAEAAPERDRLYAALDDGARVRAESMSRDLPVPMPAGWLADDATGVRVWSPSWYRNGTFKVRIEADAVDGLAHGPGRVILTATLYGRSDRTYEGRFVRGMMLDEAMQASPPAPADLLEADQVRLPLDAGATGNPHLQALWRQTELGGMRIEKCPNATPDLFAVMAPDFPAIDDAQVRAVAVAAVETLAAVCPLPANTHATVVLLPPGYEVVYRRGVPVYAPQLAEVTLYGFDRQAAAWSVQVRNHAREAHARQAYEAEQARRRQEREERQARTIAAALARAMPDIRGFRLGIGFDAFKAGLGDQVVRWEPKLTADGRPDHKQPAFTAHEQTAVLADGAVFTVVIASAQNGGRIMALSYEQHLRDGPDGEALRQQLYAKYGAPDEEGGGRAWPTWWLKSTVDGAPKGAALKGNFQTDRQTGKATYLRLVLSDYNLGRKDEADRVAARRQAEREAFEKGKSDKVRF